MHGDTVTSYYITPSGAWSTTPTTPIQIAQAAAIAAPAVAATNIASYFSAYTPVAEPTPSVDIIGAGLSAAGAMISNILNPLNVGGIVTATQATVTAAQEAVASGTTAQEGAQNYLSGIASGVSNIFEGAFAGIPAAIGEPIGQAFGTAADTIEDITGVGKELVIMAIIGVGAYFLGSMMAKR
jgi:hypothetical protein